MNNKMSRSFLVCILFAVTLAQEASALGVYETVQNIAGYVIGPAVATAEISATTELGVCGEGVSLDDAQYMCMTDSGCVPVGTRFSHNSKLSFCAQSTDIVPQKIDGDYCRSSYECLSELCLNSACTNESAQNADPVGRIMQFLSRIFSM